MFVYPFSFTTENHARLVQEACSIRRAAGVRGNRPGCKDQLYLRLGNLLVEIGGRLQAASPLDRVHHSQRKRAFPDLQRECA